VRAPRGPGSPARRSGAPSARHPGPTARRAAAVSSAAHPTGPRIASRNMIARRRYLTADDRPCYPGQYPLLRLVATTPTDRTAQAVISWSHPSSAAGMCRWPSASTRKRDRQPPLPACRRPTALPLPRTAAPTTETAAHAPFKSHERVSQPRLRARKSEVSPHARAAASGRLNIGASWLSNAWPALGWTWTSQSGRDAAAAATRSACSGGM
jgi:hypothetical protein